jgi:hypothetical protein
MILKLILRKLNGRCGVDSSDLDYEPVVGSSEYSNEPSESMKYVEFLAC